jgi:molybdate transport system substrate-binding protein
MNGPIRVISSMATKAVLAALTRAHEARSGCAVLLESVGGVDASRRVRAGESFDVVVLANDVIDELIDERHLVSGTKVNLVQSGVAVAVRSGAERPDIGGETGLLLSVLAARSIGYSTGPSGVELAKLFERWGITEQIRDRVVTPPPGVPVGELVAHGKVELGFQQLSELIHIEGIDILGPLPATVQIVTTFSAAVGARSSRAESARALIAYLASPAAAATKRLHGMDAPWHRMPRRRRRLA